MKTLTILKGGSGAGKGTRVCQLMEYLKADGNTCETINYKLDGKTKVVGKFFPAFGLFVPGKYSVSNKSGLTSWNGMDHLHAAFGKAEVVRDILSDLVDELGVQHMILEGEPMFLSDKFRPKFLSEFYKPDVMSFIYFTYTSREEYDERIIGRSGKPSGDTGWQRVAQYEVEYDKTVKEAEWLVCDVKKCPATQPPHEFVVDWLLNLNTIAGAMVDVDHAREWCQANPMTRKIGESDPLNKSSLW